MVKKLQIDECANKTLKTILAASTADKQSNTGLLIGTVYIHMGAFFWVVFLFEKTFSNFVFF